MIVGHMIFIKRSTDGLRHQTRNRGSIPVQFGTMCVQFGYMRPLTHLHKAAITAAAAGCNFVLLNDEGKLYRAYLF